MDNLITAVGRRVNPGGQKEVTIRKYGAEQIEIIIPEKDAAQVERIEGIISRTGSLEFRILANNRDNKELIERAMADPSKMQIKDSAGNLLAWWVPVKPDEAAAASPTIPKSATARGNAGRQEDHRSPRPQGHLQRHGRLPDQRHARARSEDRQAVRGLQFQQRRADNCSAS